MIPKRRLFPSTEWDKESGSTADPSRENDLSAKVVFVRALYPFDPDR